MERVPAFSNASTIVSALAIGAERSLSECRMSNGLDCLVICRLGDA